MGSTSQEEQILFLKDLHPLRKQTSKLQSCFSLECNHSGPGFSKLSMSLVNVSLKFQMLIFENCQKSLLKKYEKLLTAKASLIFQQKISVYLVIKS